MNKVRKTIRITGDLDAWLKRVSQARGVPQSLIVERAIELVDDARLDIWEAQHKRGWRREDLYEERVRWPRKPV